MFEETDRVFKVVLKDGMTLKDTKSLIDNRLYTGENKLHAVWGPDNLWSLKYEKGDVPAALKQQFTSINKLKEFVGDYFDKRGCEIKEIA